jgi:proteasome component ECM29
MPQAALVTLLREKSELTQEVSAKGLGAIYAAALSAAMSRGQDEGHALASSAVNGLVEELVRLLRGPNAAEQTAQLEVNAAGGAAVQTELNVGQSNPFREMCMLATDLEQPHLIYHFLALPAAHTSWGGRRAVRYADGPTPGRQLRLLLEPLLPRLLPRLYRARFDPNGPTRQVGPRGSPYRPCVYVC